LHIPGHLAVALAEHSLPPFRQQSDRSLVFLLVASLFPDIVDKSVGYVFHAMPNGRHYAHNIFSLVGLSLLVRLIWGRTAGYAWFFGYAGHLLADSESMVPWFFPLKNYPFKRGRLTFEPTQLIRESILLLLILIFWQKKLPLRRVCNG
jgi:hypothetical protein